LLTTPSNTELTPRKVEQSKISYCIPYFQATSCGHDSLLD